MHNGLTFFSSEGRMINAPPSLMEILIFEMMSKIKISYTKFQQIC